MYSIILSSLDSTGEDVMDPMTMMAMVGALRGMSGGGAGGGAGAIGGGLGKLGSRESEPTTGDNLGANPTPSTSPDRIQEGLKFATQFMSQK